jgi:membrane protease YdiL (CAAX protease family)
MKLESTGIAILLVAITYAWLAYSMIILREPMITMLIYHPILCLGGGLLLRKSIPDIGAQFLQIKKINQPVFLTFVFALLASGILWACNLLIRPGLIDPGLLSDGLESIGMAKENYWLTAGYLAIVNPFAEEFLWRSAVFPFFLAKTSRIPAVLFMSLIFAGYHPVVLSMIFPPAWLILVFVVTFVGGVFFAYLYMRTRSLWYPIVMHLVVNINLMFIGYIYSPSSTP